jgi:type VI secretion system protein ImpE
MSSETTATAGTLFKEGRLTDAVAAANAAVRATPADLGARILLAELLLFAGNIERADVILDAAAGVDPSALTVVAEFRQLLRAETARRQLHRDGRVPEFLGEPTESQRETLAALVALRAGDHETAARHAEAAEAVRPRAPGTHDGTAFADFRDADDLCAGFFEVLTTTGKYYWVPTERVMRAEFHPPRRPRDLAWRRVTMEVQSGPDGEVYVPATYFADGAEIDAQLRLGRATDWREGPGPVTGIGQRLFLAGEEAVAVMSLGTLTFAAAEGA